jgi:DNA-directed RNA polymerase subunit RPC12/RpoP
MTRREELTTKMSDTRFTVECRDCGFVTDMDTLSQTNPKHCPECGSHLFLAGTSIDWKYIHDPVFMNLATGSTGHYDDWEYENEEGNRVNAVDRDEVAQVYKNENGDWEEM